MVEFLQGPAQGLLFIILGLPLWLKKVPPNGLYGYRTSFTLSDERVWYLVNQRCGRNFFFGGIVILAATRALSVVPVALGTVALVLIDCGLYVKRLRKK